MTTEADNTTIVDEMQFSDYINYGNHIQLEHHSGYETLYAHLSEIYVQEGDDVVQGQIIGACGNSGWTTGNMVHFEVRYNGRVWDPEDFVEPPKAD